MEKITAKLKNVKGKVRLHGVAYISGYMSEFRNDFFQKTLPLNTVRPLAEDRVRRSPDPEIPKIRMSLLRSPGFHPWTQDRQGTLNSRKPCWTLAVLAIAFDLKIARVKLRAQNGQNPPP